MEATAILKITASWSSSLLFENSGLVRSFPSSEHEYEHVLTRNGERKRARPRSCTLSSLSLGPYIQFADANPPHTH